MKVFSVERSSIDEFGNLLLCLCKTHEGAMDKAKRECNKTLRTYNGSYVCREKKDIVYIALEKFDTPIEAWRVKSYEVRDEEDDF